MSVIKLFIVCVIVEGGKNDVLTAFAHGIKFYCLMLQSEFSIPDLEIVMPEIIENKSINEFATAPMNTEPFCSNLDDNKLAYNKLPSIEKDVSEFSHYGHDINNRYILGEVSRLVFKAA